MVINTKFPEDLKPTDKEIKSQIFKSIRLCSKPVLREGNSDRDSKAVKT
jgi:monomeric isocitrate dehydrogenase